MAYQATYSIACAGNSAAGIAAVYCAVILAYQAATPGVTGNAAGGKAILYQCAGFVVTGDAAYLVAAYPAARSAYRAQEPAIFYRPQIVAHNSATYISISDVNGGGRIAVLHLSLIHI